MHLSQNRTILADETQVEMWTVHVVVVTISDPSGNAKSLSLLSTNV